MTNCITTTPACHALFARHPIHASKEMTNTFLKSNLIYLAMAVLGGLSLVVVLGLLIVVASLVAEHGL